MKSVGYRESENRYNANDTIKFLNCHVLQGLGFEWHVVVCLI